MQSYSLSSSSWHFWMANWGNRRVYADEPIDICSYIRKVIAGFLNMVAATIMCAVVVAALGFVFVSSWYWMFRCMVAFELLAINPPEFVGMILNTAVLIAVVRVQYDNYKDSLPEAPAKPPGFLSLAQQKVKSKTCFMIRFNQD